MIQPTVVVSAKKDREGLYIGRAFAGFEASPFLNPFSVGEDTPQNRIEAVWKFTKWFLNQPQRFELDQIRNAKQVVCWCAPSLCHGHVLAWLVAHQKFRGPCVMCGEPMVSKMNGFDHGPHVASYLVYEQGECRNPPCRHYRFTHTANITKETIPAWAAEHYD